MSRLLTGIPEIDASLGGRARAPSDVEEDRNLKPNVTALERMLKSQQRTNKRIMEDSIGLSSPSGTKSNTFVSKRLRALEQINRLAAKHSIPIVAFPLAAESPNTFLAEFIANLTSRATDADNTTSGARTYGVISWDALQKIRDADTAPPESCNLMCITLPCDDIPVVDALATPSETAVDDMISGTKRKRDSGKRPDHTAFLRAIKNLPSRSEGHVSAEQKDRAAVAGTTEASAISSDPAVATSESRQKFRQALGASSPGAKPAARVR